MTKLTGWAVVCCTLSLAICAPAGMAFAAPPEPAGQAPSLLSPPVLRDASTASARAQSDVIHFDADEGSIDDRTGDVHASGHVVLRIGETTVSSDRLDGNVRSEVTLTGNAHITAHGATSLADAIHVYPKTHGYRLDNPRATLDPSLFNGQILHPVYIRGGSLAGTDSGYGLANDFIATTCIDPRPHYALRVRRAELIPGRRLILRHVGVMLFGRELLVLPALDVNLNQRTRRYRTDYLPEVGSNLVEGYYAHFPYEFATGKDGAALVRFDVTQKHGPGFRIEQEYLAGKQDPVIGGYSAQPGAASPFGLGTGTFLNATGYGTLRSGLPRLGTGLGPDNGGLIAVQGYLGDGLNRNFTASVRHQQSLGSNNRVGLSFELQRSSDFTFSDQTTTASRFDFAHADTSHGMSLTANLGLSDNSSAGFSTSQLSAAIQQSFQFDTRGSNTNSFQYGLNLAQYQTAGGTFSNRSSTLDSDLQFQHTARDFSWLIQANKSTPLGSQTDASTFGTLEKLPEFALTADTSAFKGGWLRGVPALFNLVVGSYNEPGTVTGMERFDIGVDAREATLIRGRTELLAGGGFEQRYYSDTAAQYILKDTVRLRQHLAGHSGVDVTYAYQQPEGGTPFLFDQFGREHTISAEAGYLDDSHFQLTARVGYDLLGTSFESPWQTVSTRLMWRPTPSFRFDGLAAFDPNTSRLSSVTGALRARGPRQFALDIITNYDPIVGRLSDVNGQFQLPFFRSWRLSGLLRYNGFNGRFESTNLELAHTWDCLEATLTYTDSPFGFQAQRQLFFNLRITAFPFFQRFYSGAAGSALGPGIGAFY